MKKKIITLALTAVLSVLGVSTALAADYGFIAVTKNGWDSTTQIDGKNQYGRFGVEVTKGGATATLYEKCSNNTWVKAHDIYIYSTTNNASFRDYWMSSSCKYTVELQGEDVELAKAYGKNSTN
jgi:hypothetical protein